MVTVREAVAATEPSRTYTTYLTIVGLAGWALTSYDMDLLVLTIPDISQNLGLSQSQVGSLIFFVAAAQFVVALLAGYGMDTLGRKHMWMLRFHRARNWRRLLPSIMTRSSTQRRARSQETLKNWMA
jgi:MFS family permease